VWRKKRTYGIFFTLFVVLAVVLISNFYIEPLLEKRLKVFLEENDGFTYSYTFDDFSFTLFPSSLKITGLQIVPKDTIWTQLKNHTERNALTVENAILEIKGVPVWKYFYSKDLSIKEIIIQHPEIKLYYSILNEEAAKNVLIEETFPALLNEGRLSRLNMINAALEIYDIEKERPIFHTDSISVQFEDVLINKTTLNYLTGMEFKEIAINSNGFNVAIDKNYNISSKGIFIQAFSDQDESNDAEAGMFIQQLELKPSMAMLAKMGNERIRSLSRASIKRVRLENLAFERFFKQKDLSFTSFTLEEPDVELFINTKETKAANPDPIGSNLGKFLAGLKFDSLKMIQADVTVTDFFSRETLATLYGADLWLEGLRMQLDSLNDEVTFRTKFSIGIFQADSLNTDVSEFYGLSASNLSINAVSRAVFMEKIYLKPAYTAKQFSRKIKTEQDWFSGNMANVQLQNLDLTALYASLSIKASSLRADSLNLAIYRDKHLPDNNKPKPLPGKLLRDLPIDIKIDSLISENMEITYEQVGDNPEQAASSKIKLDQMSIHAFNITNMEAQLQTNEILTANLKARFLEKTNIHAQYRFSLTNKQDRFTLKGSMNPLPAFHFSPLMESLLLVKVPAGQIRDFDFNLVGNNRNLQGNVELEYEGLEIEVMNRKKNKASTGFMNFVTKTVVKRNNLRSKRNFTVGKVYVEREPNKSFINYSVQGLKDGILYSIVPLSRLGKNRR